MHQGHRDSEEEVSINVAVRVRPPTRREMQFPGAIESTNNSITVENNDNLRDFAFDHILNEQTTQKSIFSLVTPLIDNFLDGYNATVFCYGQTAAGKSYTMFGPNLNEETNSTSDLKIDSPPPDSDRRGLTPRAVEYIFERLNGLDCEWELSCSFLELYREKIYDLLSQKSYGEKGLSVRENSKGEIIVLNSTDVVVEAASDVYKLLELGSEQLEIGTTLLNLVSSRSHSIFTFHLILNIDGEIYKSKLNLVDLAGSERYKTAMATTYNQQQVKQQNKRVKELTSINSSLSVLSHCISALLDHNRVYIPWRDSKLTRLLKDSLGGNTKTMFFICISPSSLNSSETVSSLSFGQRVKHIKSKVVRNAELDMEVTLKLQAEEIKNLRRINADLQRNPVNNDYVMKLQKKVKILNKRLLKEQKDKLYLFQIVQQLEKGSSSKLPTTDEGGMGTFLKDEKIEMNRKEAELNLFQTQLKEYSEFLNQCDLVVFNNKTQQWTPLNFSNFVEQRENHSNFMLDSDHSSVMFKTQKTGMKIMQKIAFFENEIESKSNELINIKTKFLEEQLELQDNIRRLNDKVYKLERINSDLVKQLDIKVNSQRNNVDSFRDRLVNQICDDLNDIEVKDEETGAPETAETQEKITKAVKRLLNEKTTELISSIRNDSETLPALKNTLQRHASQNSLKKKKKKKKSKKKLLKHINRTLKMAASSIAEGNPETALNLMRSCTTEFSSQMSAIAEMERKPNSNSDESDFDTASLSSATSITSSMSRLSTFSSASTQSLEDRGFAISYEVPPHLTS
ncbi:hypothetical protein PCE1_002662 [Barthelona sp. PCE]